MRLLGTVLTYGLVRPALGAFVLLGLLRISWLFAF
jgi:hypothetical protein